MFCPNCGKELQEGARFCANCGSPVNVKWQDTRAEEFKEYEEAEGAERNNDRDGRVEQFTAGETEDGQGVAIRREFTAIQQLNNQDGKSRKRWKVMWIVLGILFAYMSLRALVSAVEDVWNGTYGWMWVVEEIVTLGLIASGVLFFLFKVCMPGKQRKCVMCMSEILKVIRVNDKQEFMRVLERVSCASIQRVYMDENGEVCIQGKYGRYSFIQTEDGMTLAAQKENYRTALERETIAGCLLKHSAPDAPLNAYENERRNRRLAKCGRIGIVFAAVFAVSCVLSIADVALGCGGIGDEGYRYVRLVKQGHPSGYPDISYEEAFKSFFANRRWKYFRSTDKQDVVEFHGKCSYEDKLVDVGIQFIVSYEEGSFELYAMDMDGEEQPWLLMYVLVMKIFEDCDGTSGDPGEFGIDDLNESNLNGKDWDIENWDVGDGGAGNLDEERTDAGDTDSANREVDHSDINDLDENQSDLPAVPGQDMSFLEGSYLRSMGPKCGLSIWSADERGISFAMGIGESGYRAYVDIRDCVAEWVDTDTAVYESGSYSMTFTLEEDGGIYLQESEAWDPEFPLVGVYYKEGTESEYVEYVFPDSDSSYITIAEFNIGKSASECKIGRNEIYARHGRRFSDEQLQAYFDGCSWYVGTTEPEDFSEDILNEIERENLQAIIDYETSMGYR